MAGVKSYMYRFLLLLFCGYWLATLFFILPKNPLSLQVQGSRDYFEENFSQRWSFFAPPPNFNQRMYFIYKNKLTGQHHIFEVFKPVLQKKCQTAPFNAYYQSLDYVLASTMINIEGNVRLLQQVYKHEHPDGLHAPDPSDSLMLQNLISEIEKTPDFITLSNYAKKVARENKLDLGKIAYKIQLSKIGIPQFIDRDRTTGKEEITFSSHYLNF